MWALLTLLGFVIKNGRVTSQLWDPPDIEPDVLEVENEDAGNPSLNHSPVGFPVLLFCCNPLFYVRSDTISFLSLQHSFEHIFLLSQVGGCL